MGDEKINQKVNTGGLSTLEIALIGAVLGLLILSQVVFRIFMTWGWSTMEKPVAAMAADQNGNIWVVDMEKKLWMVEGKHLISTGVAPDSIPLPAEETITVLTIDRQSRFWVGTSSGKVAARVANGEWFTYTLDDSNYSVKEIIVDIQGRAWVQTEHDLGLIDPILGKSTYNFDTTGLTGVPSDIAVDEQGQVWVIMPSYLGGNEDELKVLGSNGEWKYYAGLKEDWMGGFLVIDADGQVWFGPEHPDGEDVRILNTNGTIVTRSLGDHPTGSDCEFFDERGWLWICSNGIHVMKPDGDWVHYEPRTSGMPWGGIMNLTVDKKGQAWVLIRSEDQNRLTRFDIEAVSAPYDRRVIAQALIFILVVIVLTVLILAWILSRRVPGSVRFKIIRDFCIGMLGWFGAILLYWYASRLAGMLAFLCIFIPFIPSVIGGTLLYRKRKWMALGALAAFVINSIGLIFMPPSTAMTSYPAFILGFIPYFY